MKRAAPALALLLLVLLASSCGGSGDDPPSSDGVAAAPELIDLTSVDELRQRFNADRGVPRLLVLVAPT